MLPGVAGNIVPADPIAPSPPCLVSFVRVLPVLVCAVWVVGSVNGGVVVLGAEPLRGTSE